MHVLAVHTVFCAVDQAYSSEIRESRQPDTVIGRQNVRQSNLIGADGKELAADSDIGDCVAGTDAGDLKAAERRATFEKSLVDRNVLTAIAADIAGIQRKFANQIEEERMVIFHAHRPSADN